MGSRHGRLLKSSNHADSCFDVRLRLEVNDPRLLWRIAAARALSGGGLVLEDVEDMIGPEEDPSRQDCLIMLLVPHGVEGCTMRSIHVSPVLEGDEADEGYDEF